MKEFYVSYYVRELGEYGFRIQAENQFRAMDYLKEIADSSTGNKIYHAEWVKIQEVKA